MSTKKKAEEIKDAVVGVGEKTNETSKVIAESLESIHEKRKAETVETLVYVGPSLPGNALQQYSMFTGDLPIYIKEHTEKCPFILELIVPVKNLSTVTSNLAVKGSKDQVMYQKIIEFYKGAPN